jgi:DNA-binding XRE family transcriptional regulator
MARRNQTDSNKKELIEILVRNLPVLRAKLRITQGSLAEMIGVSRQTYVAIETGKRFPAWNIFVPLFLYVDGNEESRSIILSLGDFEERVKAELKAPEAQYIKFSAYGENENRK